MKNRLVVHIDGQPYTLVADESEEYMARVASRVDLEIARISETVRGSATHTAVLAAIQLADELLKSQDTVENLREQLKAFLDESARMKAETAEMRRELNRLKKNH